MCMVLFFGFLFPGSHTLRKNPLILLVISGKDLQFICMN